MSPRLERLGLWLGATVGGAGLIYAAMGASTDTAPALLGIMWVLGAALLAVGILGFATETVALVNRVLPDQPSPPSPREPVAPEPSRSGEPHPTGRAPAPAPVPLAVSMLPISEPAPRTPPPYERMADGRLVYNVTLQQLIGHFKDQTTAQGNKRVEAWIGKLMRFTGTVFNVNERETWAMVSLDPIPNAEGLVSAFFNTPELISRVAVFTRGDRVGVIGRIKQVEATSVHLEDCELVEP